jgi:hypothetical protein
MASNTIHYVLIGAVVITLILVSINLWITYMQYSKTKEGYFSGGGPFGYTSTNTGAFGSSSHGGWQ